MAGQNEMRVGDTEREQTVAELREHYASGRLTQEEFNERVDQTFAAKTHGDLRTVLHDLPSARPLATAGAGAYSGGSGNSGGANSGRSSASGARTARGFGPFAAMMTAIWSMILVFSVLAFSFGFGGGRPLFAVLFFAALAMIRRLVFGRRRGFARAGRCGPRRGPRR
jgi:hypothetical protein